MTDTSWIKPGAAAEWQAKYAEVVAQRDTAIIERDIARAGHATAERQRNAARYERDAAIKAAELYRVAPLTDVSGRFYIDPPSLREADRLLAQAKGTR